MDAAFPLTALSVGQQARIVRIVARGELARRIRDMGLGTGMAVSVMGYAPLRDPLALRCAEATIALRRREARTILVRMD
ncbi:FeoA family protein [Desulfovibrio legallii]|jgi:ferrous iron transport protein A|uniref:Ferrous iron transport protein A n=1 Tax=Desulfovibrio legallii TaxID=571438 RepID=A0A1G7ING9_9BACT|nr:FeoA family protein [Desulfovibrio legallii]SDF14302.1 ferrous iron transport protein A [Desulfovibrio legallii]